MPKMEFTAATLLIKMDKLIMRELEGCIKIHSVTWTDLMIVLRYIFNETKRFVTFFANRVAVIREGSRPSQWRHIRSEVNPADLDSRGIKASETKKLEVWKHCPDFLWKDQKEWLRQRRNFKVGDLVIMKDANLSRGQWPKVLVRETFPDSDGVVRQVLVKSATGVFRRDIRKLFLLEEELLKSIEESMEKNKN